MNFGLERGMLCMILWFTDNTTQKAIILNRDPNIRDNTASIIDKENNNGEESEALEKNHPIMDTALSGMYYIDGTDWEYNNDNLKTTQHLYLIKKGSITQYYDKTGITRF